MDDWWGRDNGEELGREELAGGGKRGVASGVKGEGQRLGGGQFSILELTYIVLNRFLNGTLFGVYEPIRRLPLEHGGEPLHLLEAFRRVVVSDWTEPEQRHRLCYKCRWLRFFRVEQEPSSSPPINAEPRVNPSASSDVEAGMDPPTNADPAMAGVKCRCLCWKQCCPCFKCRWLCCFRVGQEPHASPSINAETSVNRSTGTDLEAGGDLAASGDLEMTGLNAIMCSVCRFLYCCRIQEIDGNPASSANVDTDVNLTTVAVQAIGAAPVTNIGPSAPADQATRWGSRLSNLRSRIRLRRGVGREMSNVGRGRDLRKELHSFRSVTDLKAKGIEVEPSSSRSLKDVEFKSGFFCAQLKLSTWFVSLYTKIFFLNMIAFELSPNNFNNHMVTSYINLMKSLIESPEDVKELREKKVVSTFLAVMNKF
ncbi:hypothetical protein Sango_0637800 [Sesamum angolense]|uniref:Uncharacterized protein n=1 Tax=Sesamum angolense TaxID=2727404 RepID=A0AAE1X6Q8_9LAMI|nr:hypothetical protein Sango_0637800 [Sesamum angolense]